MDDFQREKNVLHQLVKAQEAIKQKYRLLKYGKDSVDKALNATFKPIVDPLQEILSETKKNRIVEPRRLKRKHVEEIAIPTVTATSSDDDEFNFETAASEDDDTLRDSVNISQTTDDESYFDKSEDKYIQMLRQNETSNLDQIYGVRKQDGQFMIGNLPINFEQHKVKVDHVVYPKTVGLMELLITKNPNQNLVSNADLQSYRKILEMSSAHKKKHNKDESVRAHRSNKFNSIIAPMFNLVKKSTDKRQGGSLSPYKIARRVPSFMDYIYWDDPNELVDRLRLLIAERSAGNQSHTNEIHSIIEELRESGYIY